MSIPIFEIHLPEYNVKTTPDHKSIGKKIDAIIIKNFLGDKIAIRGLGSQEHPSKTQDELIEIIKQQGIDRYDPKRRGDRYENIGNKKIDFFAIDRKITQKSRVSSYLIKPFYKYPPQFGRVPIKVDILIIYDMAKLKRVVHQYEGRKDIKRDGFVFKDQNNKPDAIKAIIKIT
jgi:hypothetical protein